MFDKCFRQSRPSHIHKTTNTQEIHKTTCLKTVLLNKKRDILELGVKSVN